MDENLDRIASQKRKWEEGPLASALQRFDLERVPTRFYTPLDVPDFDFLEKVGFPGEYPFTSATYPTLPYAPAKGAGAIPIAPGLRRSGRYSGYGTAADTRDYYLEMQALGREAGPNLAFDLPTQLGIDSDHPEARGEVGRVGVAVNTLRDIEVIYEAFLGKCDLDRIASNFTISAPANVILAMYFALAEKRGVPLNKLRGTPQNDPLKEYVARGTYIWPPGPQMRMMRDTITFFLEYVPSMNFASIGGYHIREAGATRGQDMAFSFCFGKAYLRAGTDAGLDIDAVAPRLSFNAFGGSLEFFREIAFQRAARRVWAKVMRQEMGATNPRSWLLRQPAGAHMGYLNATRQRPLNNLTRAVVGAMASALSGGPPLAEPPFDEPLGLGWSREAMQLAEDASRILQFEAHVTDVIDPLAGSYYVESLTDQMEDEVQGIMRKIEEVGGAVAAIESGYMQREMTREAYERQVRIETGEQSVVGVNCFVGKDELEVSINRFTPYPYDPRRREIAEEVQLANLAQIKEERNGQEVMRCLGELKRAAKDQNVNLIPYLIACAKTYATIGEMCGTLTDLFGEYRPLAL